MIIRKSSLFTALLSVVVSGVTVVSAQDCGSNYSSCCETSCCDGKFKLGAEWLYWKGEQDNMALAQTETGNSDPTSPDFLDTDVMRINPNYKYSNGFRITAGYELPCNCWEVDLIYTNLPIHAKSSLVAASNPLNNDDFGAPIVGPFTVIQPNPYYFVLNQMNSALGDAVSSFVDYQTFQEKWQLNFNQFDVDIGRTICFNECISIRPHVGFRAAWYTDKQNAVFTGTSTDPFDSEFSSIFEADAKFRNQFTGYGVEAGLWAFWQIGCGLSFVGHFGGSILYAKYTINEDVESVVTVTDNGATPPPPPPAPRTQAVSTTVSNISTTFHDVNHVATPTMEYFFGLEYADTLCDMTFAIRGGWEQHVYFESNRFFQAGNLSMQGLTLGLEVGF